MISQERKILQNKVKLQNTLNSSSGRLWEPQPLARSQQKPGCVGGYSLLCTVECAVLAGSQGTLGNNDLAIWMESHKSSHPLRFSDPALGMCPKETVEQQPTSSGSIYVLIKGLVNHTSSV